uniref:Uncharacterized protein n=1 Tax=Romanomermis culicivorax TaxID=13658 RepID=A0A915HEY2_ROMCU
MAIYIFFQLSDVDLIRFASHAASLPLNNDLNEPLVQALLMAPPVASVMNKI